MQTLTLDIIIPCYNASNTIARAIESVLIQENIHQLIIIDDGSTDNSWEIITHYQQHYPHINAIKMPFNSGVAMARNWGAMSSQADLIAFLDADDAYEKEALAPVILSFSQFSYLSLIRLAVKPVNFPKRYITHPNFEKIWQIIMMTITSNTIFRRNIFLASGGFPSHELFRRFGGEDVALGNAFNKATIVGTIFTNNPAAVLHYYHPNIHARKILESGLFQNLADDLSQYIAQAEAITDTIATRLSSLKLLVSNEQTGVMPLYIEYE